MLPIALLEGGGGGFDALNLNTFGANFLWTLLIFLLALGPIWKVVMGPITRALTDRDEVAAKAIHSAEEASEAAERARAEVEVNLGEARAESAKLVEAARDRAEVREREIVENAKSEAKAMVEQAQAQIVAEKDKAALFRQFAETCRVAERRVNPDIKILIFKIRDRYPKIWRVPCDVPVAQTFIEPLCQFVGHFFLQSTGTCPRLQLLCKLRQQKEYMHGFTQLRRTAADCGTGIDQVSW